MTESRAAGRLRVLPRVLASRLSPRRKPAQPKRVLIAHHLLLGDVVMLAPLLAKLR
ncbi:MAG: heptosyltransferase, partial [Betaproteobacteria bacterium]